HHGLSAHSVRLYPHRCGPWDIEQDPSVLGYEAAGTAFADGCVPSGVISANDGVAFGFLEAASQRGKVAGVDFALVSFDDHPQARDCGLASVRPPMEVMGK